MMKKNFVVMLNFLAVMLIWTSCATAPPEDLSEVGSREAVDAAKATADAANSKAKDAKAPIAVPTEYDTAMVLYSEAESADKGGDLETALSKYGESERAFLTAATAAEEAKKEALAAMQAADQAIADTESAVDNAIKSALEAN